MASLNWTRDENSGNHFSEGTTYLLLKRKDRFFDVCHMVDGKDVKISTKRLSLTAAKAFAEEHAAQDAELKQTEGAYAAHCEQQNAVAEELSNAAAKVWGEETDAIVQAHPPGCSCGNTDCPEWQASQLMAREEDGGYFGEEPDPMRPSPEEAERLIADDEANRTPDAELDPSELEDQPEEVAANRQRAANEISAYLKKQEEGQAITNPDFEAFVSEPPANWNDQPPFPPTPAVDSPAPSATATAAGIPAPASDGLKVASDGASFPNYYVADGNTSVAGPFRTEAAAKESLQETYDRVVDIILPRKAVGALAVPQMLAAERRTVSSTVADVPQSYEEFAAILIVSGWTADQVAGDAEVPADLASLKEAVGDVQFERWVILALDEGLLEDTSVPTKRAGNADAPAPPVVKTQKTDVQNVVNELVWLHGPNVHQWADWPELLAPHGVKPGDVTNEMMRKGDFTARKRVNAGESRPAARDNAVPVRIRPPDDGRLEWMFDEKRVVGATSYRQIWETVCGRYRVSRATAMLSGGENYFFAEFFSSVDGIRGTWQVCELDLKMGGSNYPKHYRSLGTALEAAERTHCGRTGRAKVGSNREEMLIQAEAAGLVFPESAKSIQYPTSPTTDTMEEDMATATKRKKQLLVDEKQARELLAAMGFAAAGDAKRVAIVRNLNTLAEMGEADVREPEDKTLKGLLANIRKALGEHTEIGLEGDAPKAASNGHVKAPAAAKPAKVAKKDKVAKSDTVRGPSNKEQVYKAWLKNKDKSAKNAEEYANAVNQAVKVSTIRGWISAWGRGDNLPSCATK